MVVTIVVVIPVIVVVVVAIIEVAVAALHIKLHDSAGVGIHVYVELFAVGKELKFILFPAAIFFASSFVSLPAAKAPAARVRTITSARIIAVSFFILFFLLFLLWQQYSTRIVTHLSQQKKDFEK